MALTKNDLKSIQKIVKAETSSIVNSAKKELVKKIDDKIDDLARKTKIGFDGQDEKINFLIEQTKSVNKKQATHDFEITETVKRVEYHELKERVDNLEEKVDIKK